MTTVNLEIPQSFSEINLLKQRKNINIVDLFSIFWIDINFLVSEKKYQSEYLNDLKNNDFNISKDF